MSLYATCLSTHITYIYFRVVNIISWNIEIINYLNFRYVEVISIIYITLNHKSKSLIILSIYLPTITLFIYKINNNKIFLNRGIYIYIYIYIFYTQNIS